MIYKDVLDNLIRLVAVYSCERMKILNKYKDFDRGLYFLNEEVVKPKIHDFLISHSKQLLMIISDDLEEKAMFEDWDEKRIKDEFLQYFWDFMQDQPFAYNSALLKSCNLSQDIVDSFMIKLSGDVMNIRSEYALLDEYYEFIEKFSISSLLSKDRLNQFIFIYYRILYELETEIPILSLQEVNKLFLKLIQQLPYYSPFTRRYLTKFSRNPHHLTLSVPLTFSSGMLLDTLFHFLYQLIQELFYVGFFEIDLKFSANLKKELEIQQLDRFSETTKIMNELLKNLPKEQSKTYDASVSNQSLNKTLCSLLFAQCKSQFENDVLFPSSFFEGSFLRDFYEIPPNEIGENEKLLSRQLYKTFFNFMKSGFEEQGFNVDMKTEGRIDKWILKITFDKKGFQTISGEQIRQNFRNHDLKKLFNYE